MKYSELVTKTMPPEKRAKASRCIVGHYLVRPISNIISIPLIEKHIDPTSVTIVSGLFPIIALLSFCFLNKSTGFWIGWISIFIWNVLDGVDGNIARYNNVCSKRGELWDATVGWLACIAFYVGMGFTAFHDPGYLFGISIPNHTFLTMGFFSAMSWIFPRLVMQKKNVLMGDDSVASLKGRENYGPIKLIVFNLKSINGMAAVIYLLAYCFGLCGLCMCGYFLLSAIAAVGSLYTLLK